jgi:hypothetical protein
MDLLEHLDKYIKHSDIIDTVNNIGIMDMNEIVEYISNGGDKDLILSNVDKDKRKEIEELIEGGII